MITISQIANFYKTVQPEGMESLVYPVSPFLGLMKKWTEFYGSAKQLAWLVSRGGGASVSFSTAQAAGTVPNYQSCRHGTQLPKAVYHAFSLVRREANRERGYRSFAVECRCTP
jgi:hypothetical protein